MAQQNKRQKQKDKVFFQKQTDGNNCRMHAINNALGRSVLSRHAFTSYCDSFDQLHQCRGSRQFFFITGDGVNLLSYILEHLGYKTMYFAQGEAPRLTEEVLDGCSAFLLFSGGTIT